MPGIATATGRRAAPATGHENRPTVRADRAMPSVPSLGAVAAGRDVAGARMDDDGPGPAVRRIRRDARRPVGQHAVTRDETCARCGHTSNGCTRCGRMDPFLGAFINAQPYCHTFSPNTPSCYTQAVREETPTDTNQQSAKGAVRGYYRNPRGQCPSCDQWKAIRKDGMMIRHSFGGRYVPCSGSLCRPKQIIHPQ